MRPRGASAAKPAELDEYRTPLRGIRTRRTTRRGLRRSETVRSSKSTPSADVFRHRNDDSGTATETVGRLTSHVEMQ
ncbi:hypothetical protein C8039_01920 [Halogeometricum sp. wsp3]|nr:hypothetical protein C8039_01920 [Halogeometricum sp. wsp3]